MSHYYYRLAVNTPLLNRSFFYKSENEYVVGDLVLVPFGRRVDVGACVIETDITEENIREEIGDSEIKEIQESHPLNFRLPRDLLEQYKWTVGYYHYSLGKHIFDCLPKTMKRPAELKNLGGNDKVEIINPTDKQQEIIDNILRSKEGFSKKLIHGVTGSGKSIIYKKLIIDTIKRGKSVLLLLPEINLTPQFTSFYSKTISTDIYTYSSAITASQKFKIWQTLIDNEDPKLLIGVRSAINLPLQNIGLIIVDEEHDSSFKQDDRCVYNARDLAIKKAQLNNIPVILGSATPSMESYISAKQTQNGYWELRERIGDVVLPRLEVEDLRTREKKDDLWPLTDLEIKKIKIAMEKGEQALIFANKLGYSSYLQCRACGFHFECPNCTSNLRYFKKRNEVLCHHCNYKDRSPDSCPECNNLNILTKGFGTEKIEEVLKDAIPDIRIGRFDRGEIKTFKQMEQVLEEFHSGKYDVLIGTQMLSKGHNFKKVNLVVVLGIDSQLNFPDFRATEKTYQLLTQISGRAGRYADTGEVLIQTLNPDNDIFKFADGRNFLGFYETEEKIRKTCNAPPYTKNAILYITSKFQSRLIQDATKLASEMMDLGNKHFKSVAVLGPRPSLIEKRANKFTWCVLLRTSDPIELHNFIDTLELNYEKPSHMTLKWDIDPINLG